MTNQISKPNLPSSITEKRERKTVPNETRGWCSWDSHPWKHPWLTSDNLSKAADFSRSILERERKALERCDIDQLKIGFVGNIANCMYVRAVPMRKSGAHVSLFLHPSDQYPMSYPEWEEGNFETDGQDDFAISKVRESKNIPEVDGVFQIPIKENWKHRFGLANNAHFRSNDRSDFPSYMCYTDTVKALQKLDVLWGTQCAYLAYLANKPYVVSQSGGDAWFETARDDELGKIMRKAFGTARLWLVSNPWSFAHGRRLGFNNLIYLPKMMDDKVYSPGVGKSRAAWFEQVGGDFFVLTSSRLDERNKGSSVGLQGFATFSRANPNARLAVIGWGKDAAAARRRLSDLGLEDKIILLPMSSKGRIRDYLRSADVFMDQFVLGYFGSAGLEAMASGVPTIGRIEMAQYAALSASGSPPILNAGNADEVTQHLEMLAKFPERRRIVGDQSREWFLNNHGSSKLLEDHFAVLASTAAARPLDLSNSPMNQPLSDEEMAYHKAGLDAAPEYPNYGW